MPRGYPGSTPGVDPGGQGVIPRRFKRKKNFVTPGHRTNGWTDRRDSRNSYVDLPLIAGFITQFIKLENQTNRGPAHV